MISEPGSDPIHGRTRHRGLTPVLLCALLAFAFAAHAQTNVYRWVDKDGKVHFTDSPPPSDAKESSSKRMGGGIAADPQMPFATQEAMKRNPATLFVSTDCGGLCDSGRALLAKRGVPYAERNAQTDKAAAEEVKKRTGGLQVPVLLLGEKPVKGFDEALWNTALDSAGYARTAIPGQNRPTPPASAQ
jgi:glutaredoxin